jgi:hypothetical protein
VYAENKDARKILGTLKRKVMTHKRHTGGWKVAEEIIPPVVI